MATTTKKQEPLWDEDSLCFALEEAANSLDIADWPGEDAEVQRAAYQEAAKRIRKMVVRISHGKRQR